MKYLSHANNTTEWMCKFYLKYCAFVFVSLSVSTLSSTLICYLKKGHFDADHAFQASKVVLVLFFNQSHSVFLIQNFIFAVCPGIKRLFWDILANNWLLFTLAVQFSVDLALFYYSLCRFVYIFGHFLRYLNIWLMNGIGAAIKIETTNGFFAM